MIQSAIFLAIASACWAICSHYTFQNNEKYPCSFWGKDSWKRKYMPSGLRTERFWLIDAPSNWYYRLFKIKYKERFPLSATALVFLTDGYHLTQWIMIKCIIAAVTTNVKWFLILWAVWLITFNIVYITKKQK